MVTVFAGVENVAGRARPGGRPRCHGRAAGHEGSRRDVRVVQRPAGKRRRGRGPGLNVGSRASRGRGSRPRLVRPNARLRPSSRTRSSRSRCRPSARARTARGAGARSASASRAGSAPSSSRASTPAPTKRSRRTRPVTRRAGRAGPSSASSTARRRSAGSSASTRSAVGPNVNDARMPGRARRRRCVDGDLRGRSGLGGLTAEAVVTPERFVVDHERLRLRAGRRSCGTASGGRRAARDRTLISSASAGGTVTTAWRAETATIVATRPSRGRRVA